MEMKHDKNIIAFSQWQPTGHTELINDTEYFRLTEF